MLGPFSREAAQKFLPAVAFCRSKAFFPSWKFQTAQCRNSRHRWLSKTCDREWPGMRQKSGESQNQEITSYHFGEEVSTVRSRFAQWIFQEHLGKRILINWEHCAQGKADTETNFVMLLSVLRPKSIIKQLWSCLMTNLGPETDRNNEICLVCFALCLIKALRLVRIEH